MHGAICRNGRKSILMFYVRALEDHALRQFITLASVADVLRIIKWLNFNETTYSSHEPSKSNFRPTGSRRCRFYLIEMSNMPILFQHSLFSVSNFSSCFSPLLFTPAGNIIWKENGNIHRLSQKVTYIADIYHLLLSTYRKAHISKRIFRVVSSHCVISWRRR